MVDSNSLPKIVVNHVLHNTTGNKCFLAHSPLYNWFRVVGNYTEFTVWLLRYPYLSNPSLITMLLCSMNFSKSWREFLTKSGDMYPSASACIRLVVDLGMNQRYLRTGWKIMIFLKCLKLSHGYQKPIWPNLGHFSGEKRRPTSLCS